MDAGRRRAWPRRSTSSRRPNRRCARASSACRPRRARRRGTARASRRPRTCRAPCRSRPRRCRTTSCPRLRAPRPRPRARGRRSTRPCGRCGARSARRRRLRTTAASPRHQLAAPSETRTTRFCCRHGPLDAWATPASGVAGDDPARDLADADQPGAHHRVRGERTARRVDRRCRRSRPSASARISSSWLNCACSSATSIGHRRSPGRACRGRASTSDVVRSRTPSPCASMRCSMPRIHAGPLAHRPGEVAGREHDRRRAVGDRCDVGVAQRMVRHRLRRARRRRSRRPCAPRAGSPGALRCERAATSARSRLVATGSRRGTRAPAARPCRPSTATAARRSTGRSAAS